MDELVIPLSIQDSRFVTDWSLVIKDEHDIIVRTIENKENRSDVAAFDAFWDELTTPKQGVEVPESVTWNGVLDSGETAPRHYRSGRQQA